jgi:polyisoprenoid-binding protein YceI
MKSARLAVLLAAAIPLSVTAAPETYKIDVDHTFPSLEFSHMGISIWRGKFNKTDGTVVLDKAAKTGTVDIVVQTESVDFGHDEMHKHAMTPDWLDTAKYPTMTYKGTIKFKGDTPSAVEGQLTLKGITKPLTLKLNSFKCIDHPFYKREACGADAEGELNRAEFGMAKGAQDGKAPVTLRISVEALKQ